LKSVFIYFNRRFAYFVSEFNDIFIKDMRTFSLKSVFDSKNGEIYEHDILNRNDFYLFNTNYASSSDDEDDIPF
jgi:hypothetical protein